MSRTCCPICDSEDVGGWTSTRCECQSCKRWTFDNKKCIHCGGKDIKVIWGDPASCGNCGWSGDPYDLIEWPEETDED